MKFGHRTALALYVILFAVLMSPYLFAGRVVAPDRQTSQLGVESVPVPGHVENRKFNDFSAAFVPEIKQHLQGKRSGWLATWSPYNELGRPLYHDSGFSPTYPPSWLLGQATGDPMRFVTLLSLGTLFLGGIFAALLVREMGLSPAAALTASVFLGMSPPVLYWLTFPMFPAVLTWACGALFALVRLEKSQDAAGWGVLAFSVYSLLMTGYPQDVVFQFYLLGGYGLYRLASILQGRGKAEALRFFWLCGTAVVAGGACAVPVYLDLLVRAADSARLAAEPAFFTAALPNIDSWDALLRFVAVTTFPELLGNPISADYPFQYDGMSVTPFFLMLALATIGAEFRKVWGWWLAILVCALFALVNPLYLLGVKYLGFHLSRSNPLYAATLPLMLIIVHAVHRTFQAGRESLSVDVKCDKLCVVLPLTAVAALAAITILYAWSVARAVNWWQVVFALSLAALFARIMRGKSAPALSAALVITIAGYGYPLLLTQRPQDISWSSPLTTSIHAHLAEDGRYAIVGATSLLPPNINASLELPSVHSYNSLSSRRYHALIERLGGSVQTFGRYNSAIGTAFDSLEFALSGISLVLSTVPIDHPGLVPVGRQNGLSIYDVPAAAGCCVRVARDSGAELREDGLFLARIPQAGRLPARKVADLGDRLEFDVSPAPSDSFLVLTQSFHRQWKASYVKDGVSSSARGFPVNGFFQGVLVPAGASSVVLEYQPYARYAWIGHLFVGAIGLMIVLDALRRRTRGSTERNRGG